MHSHVMLETMNYYYFNGSSVYTLLLDASKAFDRVNYCKLFDILIKHQMSPIVLRLLTYMYTKHKTSHVTYCVDTAHLYYVF